MRCRRRIIHRILQLFVVSFVVLGLRFLQQTTNKASAELKIDYNSDLKRDSSSNRTISPQAPICFTHKNISSLDSSAKFVTSEPRQLIILTYQRAGSTFFADMFNHNPEVFYSYEPLDAMYAAMYGTLHGWNVPSDITNYDNGTLRSIPKFEIEQVSQFLRHMLECDVRRLPTATFVHHYMFSNEQSHLVLADYIECMRNNSLDAFHCDGAASHHCGTRFGEQSVGIMNECVTILNDNFPPGLNDSSSTTHRGSSRGSQPYFIRFYKTCMEDARRRVEQQCM